MPAATARALCLGAALACSGALRLEGAPGAEGAARDRDAHKSVGRHAGGPAGAQAVAGAPGPRDSTPRVALIKFPRTGSTVLMKLLIEAACSSKACEGRWAPEVLGASTAACDERAALDTIRRFSSCSGAGGCGWSLNLFKHQRAGLRLWSEIVDVMAAQPMTVIFLTRTNPISQFVSFAVGTRRKELMTSKAYRSNFGPRACNAYQFYNCPRQVADWVNNRTYFAIDLRRMHDEVLKAKREMRVYARLEAELRERGLANLSIVHVTYEDLQRGATWDDIFRAVGLPVPRVPQMLHSDYSRFVSNWADVADYYRLNGFAI